jgi:hypothetical protein
VLVLYATEYGFSEEVRPWLIFIFLTLAASIAILEFQIRVRMQRHIFGISF